MFRFRLRGILIASALLVLAPVFIIPFWSHQMAFNTALDRTTTDNEHLALAVSAVVEGNFNDALALSYSYATDPIVMTLDAGRINERMARAAPSIPEYQNVVVFDADGDLVGSAAAVDPANVAGQEWFQEAITTGRPVVSDVTTSSAPGEPMVYVAVPIRNQLGERIGVVSTVLRTDHFLTDLAAVLPISDQAFFVADRQGRLALHTGSSDLDWERRDASGYGPVQAALKGKRFVGQDVDSVVGDRRIIAAVPAPKYGWVTGASTPIDAALAPANRQLRDLLQALAGVIAFGILLTAVTSEILRRPLKQLNEYAVALAKGNLDRRLNLATACFEMDELGRNISRMALEIKLSEERQDDYVHSISHDLRAPLTVILGHAQLIRRAAKESTQLCSSAQVVEASARRMNAMIRDLVDSARLENGQLQLESRPLDLNTFLVALVQQFAATDDAGRLALDLPEDLPPVSADPNQLERILMNLLTNALKYSPRETKVLIRAKTLDDQVDTSITDRGIGIPPEELPHVFERFYRAAGVRKTEGLGLGLYITRKLVEAQGGRVWVESEPGKGSTFHFTMPAARAA
ncbi:MAG: sensor histidine kinase [Chloroflexi bacterium]|nr:sensor histidine kinase [Chloroflexota bacterium]